MYTHRHTNTQTHIHTHTYVYIYIYIYISIFKLNLERWRKPGSFLIFYTHCLEIGEQPTIFFSARPAMAKVRLWKRPSAWIPNIRSPRLFKALRAMRNQVFTSSAGCRTSHLCGTCEGHFYPPGALFILWLTP